MNDWVANDLAGRHATLRMVVRWAVPVLILMLPFLFVPASWDVRITMALPIPIAYVFFTLALNRVYRRHQLEQHGLQVLDFFLDALNFVAQTFSRTLFLDLLYLIIEHLFSGSQV